MGSGCVGYVRVVGRIEHLTLCNTGSILNSAQYLKHNQYLRTNINASKIKFYKRSRGVASPTSLCDKAGIGII